MAVYKEEKTGTWHVIYRYTDWNGERKQTQKRGSGMGKEKNPCRRNQQSGNCRILRYGYSSRSNRRKTSGCRRWRLSSLLL